MVTNKCIESVSRFQLQVEPCLPKAFTYIGNKNVIQTRHVAWANNDLYGVVDGNLTDRAIARHCVYGQPH
jgi:hypothetical protein